MKKIKWVSLYYPIGEWQDEQGSKVELTGNFKCKNNGLDILVIMSDSISAGSPGESPIASKTPKYINAATLEEIEVAGFFEV